MAIRQAGFAALAALILGTGVVSDARRRCELLCVANEHYEGMLARYKHVLIGRVEDRTDASTGPEFHVKPIRKWKGSLDRITLKNTSGMCGMSLRMGQAYVIFAMENPEDIDGCSPVIATSNPRALKAIARLDRARGLPPLALPKEDFPPPPVIPPPQPVSFLTGDDGVVHGDQYGQGRRGVVLASGLRFDRKSWERQASALRDAGFRVLVIDYRGQGLSRGGSPSASTEIHLDVLAAVRYLRKTGAETVSVVGASLGGWAASRAAVEAAGEIDRLVLLAPEAIAEPERIPGRKLFITTRDDPSPDGSPRLPEIRAQYDRAPDPKQLLVLKGSAHAQFIFTTDQSERLMKEILRFLSEP